MSWLQEQRLKFLKQQDQRQQQQAAEQEKLKRLKEIAENQEAKLKKVRALKGHVEQKRLSNGKLGELLLGESSLWFFMKCGFWSSKISGDFSDSEAAFTAFQEMLILTISHLVFTRKTPELRRTKYIFPTVF